VHRAEAGPVSGRRLAQGALLLAALAALALLLDEASLHTYVGNSDGATVVLEGQAISAGHLALSGWSMSLESFWSIDAVVYAAVERVAGLHADLLHLVPSFLAIGVVVAGALLARRGCSGAARPATVLAVVAIVGLPSPTLAFFLLQGPWHVGTVLWTLVAFGALTARRGGWLLFAVGALFLAAALLGDFMTLGIALLPVLLAGAATMARRRFAAGLRLAAAVPAAVALAALGRLLATAIGTFTLVNRNVVISRGQIGHNVSQLPGRLAALFGVGNLPLDVTHQSVAASVAHAVGLAGVLAAVGYGLWVLWRGIRRPQPEEDARLDDLLLFAVLGSIATFLLTAPSNNVDYLRYLLPAVLFAAVLAGRHLGHLVAALGDSQPRRLVLGAGAALSLAFFLDATLYLDHPPPSPPAVALSSFLRAHDLRVGLGDYWSSSLVTVESDGDVVVRPVTNNAAGNLLRYDRQSSDSWYAGVSFQFFVYDTRRPWRAVDTASAVATFGMPSHTYSVGSYRVLVWPRSVHLSPKLPHEAEPLNFYLRF